MSSRRGGLDLERGSLEGGTSDSRASDARATETSLRHRLLILQVSICAAAAAILCVALGTLSVDGYERMGLATIVVLIGVVGVFLLKFHWQL